MSAAKPLAEIGDNGRSDETLFSLIAQDIEDQGYSIRLGAIPDKLASSLHGYQQTLGADNFRQAGVGRGNKYLKNEFIRTDKICWVSADSIAGQQWLDWTANFQNYLNRRLFLGLFSFESHFAHYRPGDYYKRHLDSFRGEANRVLSVVLYLNAGWTNEDGGELILYRDSLDKVGVRVVPLMGTLVTFLSEEFPHEVLPANRDRHSIAGWFRVNTSISDKVDPPL